MSDISKKTIILLLSLIMALLPLRYAVSSVVDAVPGNSVEMTAGMADCPSLDRAAMKSGMQNTPCPGHNLDGNGVDNCCGDHCSSSAQLFPGVELSLYIPFCSLHFQEVSLSFSTIFLSPRHRPPLSFS